ncbi:MAG: ribose 5-phosphate isomerase B [Elusimicrobia bacterium]|nr:ribose 5-phosphate isomerase B [Elusimicrobiota bacterium]MBD3412367.1 ribose 5-phosphate isomerase B [Elusimicrobiota bacterium]
MKKDNVIIMGSDHAGFAVKEYVKELVKRKGYTVDDVGPLSPDRVDYPDFAEKVALKVRKNSARKGFLACATGIGISIAANKIPGIRAALVHTPREARLSREHNNANVLVVGGRPYNKNRIKKILNVWLQTDFLGDRHQRRVSKISKLERKYC